MLVAILAVDVAAGSPRGDADPALPSGDAAAREADRDRGVLPDRYIVVYKSGLRDAQGATERRGRALRFRRGHVYRHGLKGFSAKLEPRQVRALREDPAVDFVSEDRLVSAAGDGLSAQVPLASGEPTPPTGVRRILAATDATASEHSEAGVAVLDTGIDLEHPDLNAVHGRNCIKPGSPAADDEGHGTHVAGTIAARNDGSGVVGVAPDTKLHAVKVLNSNGTGSWSNIICGIDWVTANADALGIRVANMSLGGEGARVRSCGSTNDAMHKAICKSTGAGVNYVVAAGNSGWDFDYESAPDVPAAYPQVLTVTALSDSDGKPGGLGGSPSCWSQQADDRRATFSNYAATAAGRAHTIAAPGTCIRSTLRGGSWGSMSGTSMASPHAAGVVALCVDTAGVNGPCATKSPADVIKHVRGHAEAFSAANLDYGFAGDPDNPVSGKHYGFLTVHPAVSEFVSAPSKPPADKSPSPTPSSPPPGPSSSPEPSPPPPAPAPAPPAEPAPAQAVPVAVAIRRAVRSGRRLDVLAHVDRRRLAGERVELLLGTGGTLLGRARLRVGTDGRVRASGALPARAARARSLLVAIRTPASAHLQRETQIARVARHSAGLRPTSGRTAGARAASLRLSVSGRVRERLRGRIILTVRYLDADGRPRTARGTARRLRDRWGASVQVPAGARDGVVTIATRGDTRHHGQGITARLPGS